MYCIQVIINNTDRLLTINMIATTQNPDYNVHVQCTLLQTHNDK